MVVPREADFRLEQADLDSNLGVLLSKASNPAFENTFFEGVGSALNNNEFQGNTEMQDGFLQSSNFVTGVSGWQLSPASAELNVSTALLNLDIPDTTTDDSFHVESDGDTWWGANIADGIGNANASITKAGVGTFKSVVLSTSVEISGIANSSNTDISLLDMSHDLVFSVTDADTIAWANGTITLSNGRTFTIDAGNTGNMAAFTYIYLSPGDSATVLQTTTTAATASGADKRIIGTAQNETTTASFVPFGPGKPLIDGDNIGALSIVVGNLAANSVIATKINVTDLAAINADMGSITAGDIVLPTGGFIRSGQTAFDTGTGFYIANDGGTPKLSIGDASANKVTWDGTTLTVVGDLQQSVGRRTLHCIHNILCEWNRINRRSTKKCMEKSRNRTSIQWQIIWRIHRSKRKLTTK